MRYLAVSRNVADHWYPADLKKRAKVDMYLDQHHNFLRQGFGVYNFKKLYAPLITSQTYTEEELDVNKILQARALTMMEKALSQSMYLCGE